MYKWNSELSPQKKSLWVVDTLKPNLLIRIVSNNPTSAAKDISKKEQMSFPLQGHCAFLSTHSLLRGVVWNGEFGFTTEKEEDAKKLV